MSRLELTLAILKPHVISQPIARKSIRNMIVTSNFKIVRSKGYKLTLSDAEKFYEEHKEKFFYNRLTSFMTSGTSDLYILARENAIQEWRKLMGPTKVFKAQFEAPDTIRGKFGLSDTRNATHGSDSSQSASREIGVFFPDFDVESWHEKEEPFFRKGLVEFVENEYVHKIIS